MIETLEGKHIVFIPSQKSDTEYGVIVTEVEGRRIHIKYDDDPLTDWFDVDKEILHGGSNNSAATALFIYFIHLHLTAPQ